MSANIDNLTTATFDGAISGAEKPVLVDFWAPWCGPCRAIAPILEELASEQDGVKIAKVDIDDNQELAAKYGIRAIPTMLLFKGGEVVDTVVGMTSKDALSAKFASLN